MEKEKDLIEKLQRAVLEYNEEEVVKLSNEVIETDMDPKKAIMEGLAKGMRDVGELFENETYSIPEVLLCADALDAGMKILKPYLKIEKEKITKKIVIGTVEGDIHSIGKDMVKLMFEVGGFEVIDLGVNVNPDEFLNEINNSGADIVALSTMMSTTLSSMEKTIEKIREKYPDTRIMVGGAIVSKQTAERYKADGWAGNAMEALKDALRLANRLG